MQPDTIKLEKRLDRYTKIVFYGVASIIVLFWIFYFLLKTFLDSIGLYRAIEFLTIFSVVEFILISIVAVFWGLQTYNLISIRKYKLSKNYTFPIIVSILGLLSTVLGPLFLLNII